MTITDLIFALAVVAGAFVFVTWREQEREKVFRVEREAWTAERGDLLSRLMAQDWSLYCQGTQEVLKTEPYVPLTDAEEAEREARLRGRGVRDVG